MSEELLLFSQRALPTRLLDSGYPFKHPELAEALRAELQVRE
jgi:NAD dependent epimerase/dehydratase family enzyme